MTAQKCIQSTIGMAQPEATQTTRVPTRFPRCVAAALISIAGIACFAGSPEPQDPALSDPILRKARIEELRQAIKKDHETLEDLITRPGVEWNTALHEDPEMRAIADRLTEQEHALERLEAASQDGDPGFAPEAPK